MNKIYFLLITLLIFSSCNSSKQLIPTTSDLDATLGQVLEHRRITGFAVSVFNKDSILYERAFGYSDWELKRPYSLETKQVIASVSKTSIGVALMKGQELGLFDLDDPIGKHLPFQVMNPHFPDSEITIRQLAMHTSSICYSEMMTDSLGYEYPDMEIKDFIFAHLNEKGKWYSKDNYHKTKPGKLGDYTNVGATLAAYIIEYKSGMKYSDFVSQYIFEPLEMMDSDFFDGNNSDANYYQYISRNHFKKINARKDGMYPNGSQLANIRDLTRFCQMVMNNGKYESSSILSSESVREMLAVSKLKKSMDDEIHKQGIFWSTLKNPLGIPREMIGHNGGDFGVYTMMYFDENSGIGYILLSNTGMDDENHVSFVTIYKSLWNYARKIR